MSQTNGQNNYKCQRGCCTSIILFGFLHILLALSKIAGGIVIITRAFAVSDYITFGINAIINLSAGGFILISGIIWVSFWFLPHNRPLNGVNLGFAIVSLLFSLICVIMDSLLVWLISDCKNPYSCSKKVKELKYGYPMLVFSVMLVALSIGNVILSGKRCCCSQSTDVLQESTYIMSAGATSSSKIMEEA